MFLSTGSCCSEHRYNNSPTSNKRPCILMPTIHTLAEASTSGNKEFYYCQGMFVLYLSKHNLFQNTQEFGPTCNYSSNGIFFINIANLISSCEIHVAFHSEDLYTSSQIRGYAIFLFESTSKPVFFIDCYLTWKTQIIVWLIKKLRTKQ